MGNNHKFNYKWTFAETKFSKDKGTVFSCFACGGGSTMGYKLAGFEVIGCNEIDPRMMNVYIKNHSPRYTFCEPIQTMKLRDDLPPELFNLDILDGSPPCSTFSTAGDREAAWGVKKKFREGQALQVLDTLFFDFIDLAKKLQPKVVIAENVKGLLLGNAIGYVSRIYREFEEAGYVVQHYLLDAAKMGVPQRRERVFFVALRRDLCAPFMEVRDLFTTVPALSLEFNEPPIPVGEFADFEGRPLTGARELELWRAREGRDTSMSQAFERLFKRKAFFNHLYIYTDRPSPTMTTKRENLVYFERPCILSRAEVCCVSTFPQDYDFYNQDPHYICGMSVPPIMMANVASEVWRQWLSKIF